MTPDEQLKSEFDIFLKNLIKKNKYDYVRDALAEVGIISKQKLIELKTQHSILKQSVIDNFSNKELHKNSQSKVEEFRKYIESSFVCDNFRVFILDENQSFDKCEKWVMALTFNPFVKFLYGLQKGPNSHIMDICAICLGKNGYNEYVRAVRKNNKEEENRSTELMDSSPLEEREIKDLFHKRSYIYTYSEDIGQPDMSTSYKDLNFPKIDAIVIYYDIDNEFFVIENIKGRTKHGNGKIKWLGINKKAIEIFFPNSPRGLKLVFHIPELYQQQRFGRMNLLLGYFSYVDDVKGNIVTGSVVLNQQKDLNSTDEQIKPFPYKFSLSSDDNEKSVPEVILKYLFDRYKNWHKIKGGIKNYSRFKVWLNAKESKDYLKRKLTQYQYLVIYPVNSLKEEIKREEISIKLEGTFLNFKENYLITKKVESLIKADSEYKNNTEGLVQKISDNLNKDFNRFNLFPLNKEDIYGKNNINFNEDIFDQINKSVSVVIIIPNEGYKKTSSIYTIAGYALALHKKTFILHQNVKDLPLVIVQDAYKMGLYVWEYENLSEIPFHFYYKDQHNSNFKKTKHTYD